MSKGAIPDIIEIIKAHINKNYQCAEWVIRQFTNLEVIKESFLDSSVEDMRRFLAGIVYCAMLKLYEKEKG